jgi:hypothetical protein
MAEEAKKDEISIPKVGPVNKKVMIGVVVAAGGFVAWRYYIARQTPADTTDTTGTDPGFEDPGALPSVSGAVSSDNSYGSGTTDTTTGTNTYGFTGTTNSEWTQYASTQLSQSDTWSYTSILTALGSYLAGKPLSTTDQQIVQAAIAVAGYPPVGTHVVVSGGDTAITVAPTNVKVTSTTSTTAVISFTPVAGADNYRAYRSGVSGNVAASVGSPITVSGLTPNTSYTFYVAAVSNSGTLGPRSAAATGKTQAVTLATPATPTISAISTTSSHAAVAKVANATGYNWYINGVAHGHSDGPSYTFQGLKAKTTYKASVAADTATQGPGKMSGTRSFTTKSK